jgi:mono/diheme cytochrome c family protein
MRTRTALAVLLAILSVSAFSLVAARAAQQTIDLVPGPGLAEITAGCSGCHSLDYVRMNAPFLSPDAWKAEITKMRTAFGAPIDDEDSAKILAYLTANYGAAN